MKFYTLDDAPINPNDAVFRQSSVSPFFAFLFGLAMTGGMGYAAYHFHSWLLGVATLFCALFPLAFGSIFRHTLHPQNWLLRVQPNGLLVKFRSYLNESFPADRPVVIELSPGEIESAGLTRERWIFPDSDRGVSSERRLFLDLKLRQPGVAEASSRPSQSRQDACATLQTLLREERQLKVTSRWGDEPVRAVEGGVIRVNLHSGSAAVTPSPQRLMETLSGTMGLNVRPEDKRTIDLSSDPGETRQREDKILQLAENGRMLEAIKLTRNFYGYSLSEARKFVEELTGRSHGGQSESSGLSGRRE